MCYIYSVTRLTSLHRRISPKLKIFSVQKGLPLQGFFDYYAFFTLIYLIVFE